MNKVPLHGYSPAGLVVAATFWDKTRLADELADAGNSGDELALQWISRLQRYGVTSSLLTDLHTITRDIRIPTRPHLDRDKGKFFWQRELLPDDDAIPNHEAAYALLVITLVNSGLIDRLQRCALKRCHRYFFGDPRSRWCSHTCGSYYRVYKDRHGTHKAKRILA